MTTTVPPRRPSSPAFAEIEREAAEVDAAMRNLVSLVALASDKPRIAASFPPPKVKLPEFRQQASAGWQRRRQRWPRGRRAPSGRPRARAGPVLTDSRLAANYGPANRWKTLDAVLYRDVPRS